MSTTNHKHLFIFYRSFEVINYLLKTEKDLKYPGLVIFSLIIAIINKKGTCTAYDIITANTGLKKPIKRETTYTNISRLQKAGYINKTRSKRHFSRTYLTLTEKGLLLKSRLNTLLNTPIILPDE